MLDEYFGENFRSGAIYLSTSIEEVDYYDYAFKINMDNLQLHKLYVADIEKAHSLSKAIDKNIQETDYDYY